MMTITSILFAIFIVVVVYWLEVNRRRIDKEHLELIKNRTEIEKKRSEEERLKRQEAHDSYFNTPLCLIKLTLLDGTTRYTKPIPHEGFYNIDASSMNIARIRIETHKIFEDESGEFFPRASIKSFSIEPTDWYMWYNGELRKKEEL